MQVRLLMPPNILSKENWNDEKVFSFPRFGELGRRPGCLDTTKPTRSRQCEDPPDNSVIINENKPGMDTALLPDFHENFAPWMQPAVLTIKRLPQPIGFELWKHQESPNLSALFC